MAAQCADDFNETHHGQMRRMLDQLDAGVAHPVAADADEPKGRAARDQLTRDARGVQVAGDFSGDEYDLTHD